jgi:phospholipase/carboxylesterase
MAMSRPPQTEGRPLIRESPDRIEVETGPAPATSVIWLHGLGADGSDFVPIVPALGLRTPVRFVFPHAPRRPVTINAGMVMRAWYDVLALEGPRREDEAGIRESARRVEDLIAAEVARGVAPARVILAGFSQGGAMTLHVGLRHAARLGGLLVLSAYLPLAHAVAAEASPAGRGTPVFLGHGTEDPLIPLGRARAARDALAALGCPVEHHEYPIAHTVSDAEIRDLAAWLARRIGDG